MAFGSLVRGRIAVTMRQRSKAQHTQKAKT